MSAAAGFANDPTFKKTKNHVTHTGTGERAIGYGDLSGPREETGARVYYTPGIAEAAKAAPGFFNRLNPFRRNIPELTPTGKEMYKRAMNAFEKGKLNSKGRYIGENAKANAKAAVWSTFPIKNVPASAPDMSGGYRRKRRSTRRRHSNRRTTRRRRT